jgi:hypothetical protein
MDKKNTINLLTNNNIFLLINLHSLLTQKKYFNYLILKIKRFIHSIISLLFLSSYLFECRYQNIGR